MALLNNPVTIAVVREHGKLEMLDVIPVYEERANAFVPTDVLRVFEGYPRDGDDEQAFETNLDRYFKYIDLFDSDSPFYLGELLIRENGLPDCIYRGNRLTKNEICQLIAALMVFTNENIEEESAINAILNDEEGSPEGSAFIYYNGSHTDTVRINGTMESKVIVLINEEFSAQLEKSHDCWEITAGIIADTLLLKEILSRLDFAGH